MADKMQAFLGGNPMIKSVMSNPEHMAKAQEMLRNPELQKQIGGVISNPAVIKQASEVLNGLQQMNTIQAGGRRRRRKRTRKKRRKSKKRKSRRKKRRKKSRRRRKRGRGWGNFRNRIGNSGTKIEGDKCTRQYTGSECGPGLICQDGFCVNKKNSKFFYRTGKAMSTVGKVMPNPRNWRLLTGGKRKKTRRRRRR